MNDLSFVRGCILDLDGTVYRGQALIPGAMAAVKNLQQAGVGVVYLSNNASVSRAGVAAKLTGLGLAATPEQVVTGTSLAAGYVRAYYPEQRALLVGEEGLLDELRLAGVECEEAGGMRFQAHQYGLVVVGCDRHFTYAKLDQALQVLLAGGALVATDGDATYPTEDGLMPGTGAVLASIERAAGMPAIVAGKPSGYSAQVACATIGLPPEDCVVIGDRLDSDIALGRSLGGSALVLTGVTTEGQLHEARDEEQPDFVFADLMDAVQAILPVVAGSLKRSDPPRAVSDR